MIEPSALNSPIVLCHASNEDAAPPVGTYQHHITRVLCNTKKIFLITFQKGWAIGFYKNVYILQDVRKSTQKDNACNQTQNPELLLEPNNSPSVSPK